MIAQVGLRNAFNSVSRNAVVSTVQQVCPILPWVSYTLSCCSHLYFGSFLLSSSSGVQQGDPMCPMLFSLVIHLVVHQLSLVLRVNVSAWYLDDGTIAGTQQGVCTALHTINSLGPPRGLTMNTCKTFLGGKTWPSTLLSAFSYPS